MVGAAAGGSLYLACVGQFKRGKSTLINALVGEELLPSGVAPVTSVGTVVRFGQPGARVRLHGGARRDVPPSVLRDYVAEEGNHENEKRGQRRRGVL